VSVTSASPGNNTANRRNGIQWREVSTAQPCPKCHKADWCSVSRDGDWCCCRRLDDGSGKKKTDQAGAEYWLYRLNPKPAGADSWELPRYTLADGGGKRADADALHKVYSELIRHLPLSNPHTDGLKARGLASGHRGTGYRTLGKGRAKATYALVKAGLEQLLPHVPGFFVQEKPDGSRYWTMAGGGGLLIPVRDVARRIVALLVRADTGQKGPKYRYLSSKRRGGPGPGSPVHVPLFKGDTAIIRVTEGALKANIATVRSGTLTIGLPGVNSWRRAAEVLRQLGAKTARLAFDADARTKRPVGEALERLAHHLHAEGFALELELWDGAIAKGIDDLLAAGGTPELLAGAAALSGVREIVKAARLADPVPTPVPTDGKPVEAPDDPHRLARLWLEKCASHPDYAKAAFYREQFWTWNGTHWVAVPDAEMRGRLTRFCKTQLDKENALIVANWTGENDPPKVPKVTTALVSNVVQALSGDILLEQETPQPAWLGTGPEQRNYVALSNGILDVDALLADSEQVLLSHTPKWFSPVCLPFKFDPDGRCDRWDAFLKRNLDGDTAKARLLQQFVGYLLLPDTRHQKFLMMVGEGANGKSVIVAVLHALLGKDNISSVPLELFGERFRLAGTLGKLANIVAEVGELERVAEGQLKAFVVGDPIECERKFKAPFMARPTARLVLATNNPPTFSDKSDGIWRRTLLLRFTVQIPEQEQVAGMDKPEFWQESGELPGIFNWALAGLYELRQRGRFVLSGGCREEVEKLRTDSNPARRFLQEHYEAGEGFVTCADLYREYKGWCQEHGHHPLADIGFGKEVARRFPTARRQKRTLPSGRPWTYGGIRPRTDDSGG
jgi:P4 family phage/plasmid primase-like protien